MCICVPAREGQTQDTAMHESNTCPGHTALPDLAWEAGHDHLGDHGAIGKNSTFLTTSRIEGIMPLNSSVLACSLQCNLFLLDAVRRGGEII